MPAIWSSSERPISVRMVWVDGIRHAILSHDDPLLNVKGSRRRPQTSTAVKDKNFPLKFEPYKPTTQSESFFEGCFVKLRLAAVEKSNSDGVEISARGLPRRQSAPICTRIIRNGLEFRSNESYERDNVNRRNFQRPFDTENDNSNGKIKESNFAFEDEMKRAETPQLNTLSERVLQWLDLSGKVRDFELENTQQEMNDSEEDKIAPSAMRCKSSNLKKGGSNATWMKIVMPTQYLVLQDNNVDDEMLEQGFWKRKISKNREDEKEAHTRKMSLNSEKCEQILKSNSRSQEEFDENAGRSQPMCPPPGKPQLHIFMPNLKSTDIQWMSSQESLFFE